MTWLEVAAWLAYLIPVMVLFLRGRTAPTVAAPPAEAARQEQDVEPSPSRSTSR
jgi:hypothetical protein